MGSLPDILREDWRAAPPVVQRMTFTADGLQLGKTLLLQFRKGKPVTDQLRLHALLSVACARIVPYEMLASIYRAAQCHLAGETKLMLMYLGLTGMHGLFDPASLQRLFAADWLLHAGDTPEEVLTVSFGSIPA